MTELKLKPQILPLVNDWSEIHDLQTQFPTTFASCICKTGNEQAMRFSIVLIK